MLFINRVVFYNLQINLFARKKMLCLCMFLLILCSKKLCKKNYKYQIESNHKKFMEIHGLNLVEYFP